MNASDLRRRWLMTASLACCLAVGSGCSSADGDMPADAAVPSGGIAGGMAAAAGGGAGAPSGGSGKAGAGGGTAGTSGTAGGGGDSAGGSGAVGAAGGAAGGTAGGDAADGAGAGGAAGQPVPPACELTCPAHQTCVPQGSSPACACAPGYEPSGTACVWGTMPADPGFQGLPAEAWTVDPGAVMSPTAVGYLDPGEVVFSRSGPCSRSGVHQRITMPTVAQAEPLAVKLSADATCVTQRGLGCWPPDTAVVINGGVLTFDDQPASIVNQVCLGERAYGGTFDLLVRPLGQANCAVAHEDAVVDHVDIEPSATCPVPGTIPDGDFDGAVNTWGTSVQAMNAAGAVAEIAPALGSRGSAAAHLAIAACGQSARLGELISPPLSLPNLALQVDFNGTAGAGLSVLLEHPLRAGLRGTGARASARICVLEANKGMTQGLAFSLGEVGDLATNSDDCSPSETRDFILDDLKFVSDPTCPAVAYLADGGFERTDPAVGWNSTPQTGIDTTPANVHGGQRAMKLLTGRTCDTREVKFQVTVPPSTAEAGPAVQFFYKAPTLANTSLSVMAGAMTTGNLPAVPDYTRGQLCLDPTWTGQNIDLALVLAGTQVGACATIPAASAWFDDFAVTTSPDCAPPAATPSIAYTLRDYAARTP